MAILPFVILTHFSPLDSGKGGEFILVPKMSSVTNRGSATVILKQSGSHVYF